MKRSENFMKVLMSMVVIAVVIGILFPACGSSDELTEEEKLKEAEFEHSIRLVQQMLRKKQYQQAMDKLKEAEKFKRTPESKKLGQTLSVKIGEKKDDDTFKKALTENSISALEQYTKKYPSGRHIKEADEKITQLKTEAEKREAEIKRKLAASVKLRSQYKELLQDDMKEMLKTRGFFEKYYNPTGNFKNDYKVKTIDEDKGLKIVTDYATALVWHQAGSPYYMNIERAREWIAELNENKFGGYSNWRLPTMEEAASLLEKTENRDGLFIDGVFSREQKYIWTGDTFGKTQIWAIDFFAGDVNRVVPDFNVFVRPVCSMR